MPRPDHARIDTDDSATAALLKPLTHLLNENVPYFQRVRIAKYWRATLHGYRGLRIAPGADETERAWYGVGAAAAGRGKQVTL